MEDKKKCGMFHKIDCTFKKNKALLYFSTAMMGVARTLLGFPIEHLLDSIKTQWQANPEAANEYRIIKQIYQTKGLKGLYAGGLANITRGIIKNAYRFPALIVFPKLYSYILPKKIVDDGKCMRGLTALSIALSEVFILNPFERLKVVSMTKTSQNLGYLKFLKEIKFNWTKELGRGMFPYFARQLVSWVTFLETDIIFKLQARKILRLKPEEQIPLKPLVLISVLVGVTTSIIYMPLDMIKTHLQMYGSSANMRNALCNIVKEHGITGLFTGWRVKTCQYVILSLCAVIFLEKLEYWAK